MFSGAATRRFFAAVRGGEGTFRGNDPPPRFGTARGFRIIVGIRGTVSAPVAFPRVRQFPPPGEICALPGTEHGDVLSHFYKAFLKL